MEQILACVFGIAFAFLFVFGGIFMTWAILDLMQGLDPRKESLSMFFQEGAIFEPPKGDK